MNEKGKIITELTKGKPRQQEEKFYAQFSETHLNAVLLLILAATFLVQGIVKYLELVDRGLFIRPWFYLTVLSLFFLVSSVISVTFGGIITSLKVKRRLNALTFYIFVLGAGLLLVSLMYLLLILL